MVKAIANQFRIEGEVVSAERYGSGHINDTRLVITKTENGEKQYILQKINKNVFKDPATLMQIGRAHV